MSSSTNTPRRGAVVQMKKTRLSNGQFTKSVNSRDTRRLKPKCLYCHCGIRSEEKKAQRFSLTPGKYLDCDGNPIALEQLQLGPGGGYFHRNCASNSRIRDLPKKSAETCRESFTNDTIRASAEIGAVQCLKQLMASSTDKSAESTTSC